MGRLVTYSRAVLYADGSAIETSVEFDPTYRLCDDDLSYVHIKGVGEDATVRVDHIPYLIEWLQDVMAADEAHRALLTKTGGD